MSQLVFLAPDDWMFQIASNSLRQLFPEIHIEQGLLSEGVLKAKQLASSGTEIIISRGGTAKAIIQADLGLTVVEVPITAFDMIRAVEEARNTGRKIGVVAFASMVGGIDCLAPILGVDLRQYILEREEEAEAQVSRAIADGAQVVLGGVITGKVCQNLSFPYVAIRSGVEGILQSAWEARRVQQARRLEKVKSTQFRTVLDYAYEGIISIDQDRKIVLFNPVAERLTASKASSVIGQHIEQVLPALHLEKVFKTGRDEIAQIFHFGKTKVLCNKIPLKIGDDVVGAVATFHDISNIQRWEAHIRKEIYAEDHKAFLCFSDIVGRSPKIKNTVAAAQEFAATESSILILGETGSGKEIFAQSIHNASQRANHPFVAINCAALPAQILESELFGYVAGAFTGASQKGKPGLLEIAHGGTLLLDEIGEMELGTQSKLLRVTQDRKVMRLGSDKVLPVDVRIIAATNKNLKQLVFDNRFRADLYYRLNVLRLRMPTLRERPDDIELLAKSFLKKHAGRIAKTLAFSPGAIDALTRYPWPGNVRELQNTIERIVAVCKTEVIPAELVNRMLGDDDEHIPTFSSQASLSSAEEIRQALAKNKGRYSEAARSLGISRSTLWRKMKMLGINPKIR
jgi:PAS domain S-box-containing protein